MTTINKTQADFLGNQYSYDKINQINSISTDFNRQIDSAKSVNSSSIQNVLASLSMSIFTLTSNPLIFVSLEISSVLIVSCKET